MSRQADTKEDTELSELRECGRELGASFLPISKDQADSIRKALIESIGMAREERSAERP